MRGNNGFTVARVHAEGLIPGVFNELDSIIWRCMLVFSGLEGEGEEHGR